MESKYYLLVVNTIEFNNIVDTSIVTDMKMMF